MRILGIFLSSEIRTGGHIRCLELMEGLAARGEDVTVLLSSALAYEPREFAAIRLEAPYRRKKLPPASYVFRRAVEAWLEEGTRPIEPDCVLVFGESHLGAAMAAKRKLGIPVLFGLQSNTVREALTSLGENTLRPRRFARALVDLVHYRGYERRIARACDGIVFQSEYDRDDFCSRNEEAKAKSFVIGGNIGPPRFVEADRGKNESSKLRKILFMGTLGERKGLRYLVEAFATLWAEGRHDLELHVAGPGPERLKEGYLRYADQRGFREALTFYGRVPSTFPLMASCDIMVAPSLFDSYPDVILLGLHSGIPIIGSRVGGIPEMLGSDELLFPVRDAEAIASILRRALDEEGHYSRLRSLCESRREAFLFDWPEAWVSAARRMIGA
jgi:glycosyltransferase involved in cell wall biosynthesis